MTLIAFEETKKIWNKASKETTSPELTFDLEVYKQLPNIFQVGDHYYYILNCLEAKIEYVHESVTNLLGYTPEDFTVCKILDKIHPEDLPCFLNFEKATAEFFAKISPDKTLKYKIRYDYRIKKASGEYIRILQQVVAIQDDGAGGVLRRLGVHTNITHLKPEGKPVMSIIGLEGEPSYIDIKPKAVFHADKGVLSNREKEILNLLITGKHSNQISDHLHISTHTVNTHRRNILAKTGVGSTSELVAKAVREGWL